MGKHKLRAEKNCLNCGSEVEKRFCPNCGQENTPIRQSFGYLFTHFFEDLTHYESSFWKTIKNLLFKPGRLTIYYLEGKRKSFVNPVRLYIFISFITFFLISVLAIKGVVQFENNPNDERIKGVYIPEAKMKITTLEQLDSLKKAKVKIGTLENLTYKRILENGSIKNFVKKFLSEFTHNIPKALFLYLPVFAFFLWLFHNKKKWWYYDHGIFTLHYFSFLLLFICIYTLINALDQWADVNWIDIITNILNLIMMLYAFSYFFIAHHRVYQTSKTNSVLKGLLLFVLNFILILAFMVGLALFTFYVM